MARQVHSTAGWSGRCTQGVSLAPGSGYWTPSYRDSSLGCLAILSSGSGGWLGHSPLGEELWATVTWGLCLQQCIQRGLQTSVKLITSSCN